MRSESMNPAELKKEIAQIENYLITDEKLNELVELQKNNRENLKSVKTFQKNYELLQKIELYEPTKYLINKYSYCLV